MWSLSSMTGTRSPSPSASQRGQNTTSCMCSRQRRKLSSSHFFSATGSELSKSRNTSASIGLRQSTAGQRRAATSDSEAWSSAICSRQSRQPKWPQSRNTPLEPSTSSRHMGQVCNSRHRRRSRSARECASNRKATPIESAESGSTTRRGCTKRSCKAEDHSKSNGSPACWSLSARKAASSSSMAEALRCSASTTKRGRAATSKGYPSGKAQYSTNGGNSSTRPAGASPSGVVTMISAVPSPSMSADNSNRNANGNSPSALNTCRASP
mmetsp:Transcript_84714/g.244876  ORF Transcript_84714/g.244876 Transcript_84714/m.244876 type:complete len:268 (+) Transcript_84714:722-1525(+)